MDYNLKFKMATVPIYGKTIQMTSSPEPPSILGLYILQEAYMPPRCTK